jgi:hypothetical protein
MSEPAPDFENPVRWSVDADDAKSRITDRMAQKFPALARRLWERALMAPAGSRLRRLILTRGATISFAAFDRRDWDYLESIYAHATVTYLAGVMPDGSITARGWPEIRRLLMEDTAEIWANSEQRVTEIIDYGGRFFAFVVPGEFRFEASGIELERSQFCGYTFDQGVVTNQWVAVDQETMVAALRAFAA